MKITNTVVRFALVIFLASSSISFAQGYVRGTVQWRSGHPIDSTAIVAYDSLNNDVGQTITSPSGEFAFELSPGIYHLSFIKQGYRDTTLYDIAVAQDETTSVALFMRWINNCHYVVGDANGSNTFNGIDVAFGVSYFKGGRPPYYQCECTPGNTWYVSGDVNGDCKYNGLDIMYILGCFKSGWPWRGCPDCPPVP